MRYDDALNMIEYAKKDTFMERELFHLREKCCLLINDVMQEVSQTLAKKESLLLASSNSPADSVLTLRAEARQREQVAKQRRELAEAIVIGALINSDNPAWKPRDPSTSYTTSKSILLALLMNPADLISSEKDGTD